MYHLFAKIGKELKKSKHGGAEIAIQKVKESDESKIIFHINNLEKKKLLQMEKPQKNLMRKKMEKKQKTRKRRAKLANKKISWMKQNLLNIANTMADFPTKRKETITLLESSQEYHLIQRSFS